MDLLKRSVKPLLLSAGMALIFALLRQDYVLYVLDISLCAYLLGEWHTSKVFTPAQAIAAVLILGAVTGLIVYIFSPPHDLEDNMFHHVIVYGAHTILAVWRWISARKQA